MDKGGSYLKKKKKKDSMLVLPAVQQLTRLIPI